MFSYKITKGFIFDAAHQLGMNTHAAHRYACVHGHSFEVEVTLQGKPDPVKDWLMDFGDIDIILQKAKEKLDHKYLNDIEGLEKPTLENISIWLWRLLEPDLPQLYSIKIYRASGRESITLYKECAHS